VSLGGASPLSPTNFKESKPQQTGTGLLIRYGEVATTSGSTSLFELNACDKLVVAVKMELRRSFHALRSPIEHKNYLC
jgi:hypothetical protein